ncbi:biotin transporter BioY [Arthrobacter halodurans]|uniref:Biotin transporter n=1 Tax=Arthrobacter halodurans TaxID=516699 RepID=A0ABV4ULK9_9MICC
MTNLQHGAHATTPARAGIGPRDLSLIAVFAALIAALTLVPAIPVGALGVPITLQTLGVSLAALILGSLRGSASVLLYLVVGLAGIPVFARFSGGLGVLAGPSAGYLLAFPFAALVAGALATLVLRRTTRWRFALLFLSAMAGSILVTHPMGIVGMSINAQIPLSQAAAYDLLYWPGDVVKNLLAAAVAVTVFKAFPRLARRDFQR